jgi:hypothetical protein
VEEKNREGLIFKMSKIKLALRTPILYRKPEKEEKLQMITNDLNERLDLLGRELAVFSKD